MTVNHELQAALANLFVDRVTPKNIAGNPDAERREMGKLLNEFSRFAPANGFHEWWLKVDAELDRRMKTRAWPLVSEVEAACQAVRSAGQGSAGEDAIEDMILSHMTDWFGRFKSQMPGYGRITRTMALIRRGVLENEREARFRGFDMSQSMTERAYEQPMGRDERDHHERVTENLRAISQRLAPHREEFAALQETVKPQGDAA